MSRSVRGRVADPRIAVPGDRTHTACMRIPLCTAIAVLALAAPAWAQGQAPICSGTGENGAATCTSGGDRTVGAPAVVTDPVAEVEGRPMRGELHVLAAQADSSSVAAAKPHAPKPAPARGTTGQRTLPFTGIDAWLLALGGLILLEIGIRLRRAT